MDKKRLPQEVKALRQRSLVIQWNATNIFLEKSCKNCSKVVPGHFIKKQN